RWTLADIAAYVDELRGPHRATEDTAASLRYLAGYLA
ncbi:MAG: phosphotransferase, partial [Dactylosporangium sp.]|nr:phosphotransferase [Dactylosporangium sp.]